MEEYSKFPATQLALLALVRVAEPIALTSILPYAMKMVLTLHVGYPEHASFYAGLLIAAFSFAESLSSMFWGRLSDRIGRRPVLLIGSLGVMLSLFVLGFAENFWIAMAGRIFGGLLNGNIGVIQTMVGELVVNPEHEPLAYAVMPFVWSIGTVIGPSIGGLFSEPAKTFPTIFSQRGLFSRFPYLLPNLICAGFLVVAIVAGYFFLQETHPKIRETRKIIEVTDTTPFNAPTYNESEYTPLYSDSYGTFITIDKETYSIRESECSSITSVGRDSKIFTKEIIMVIVALGIFSYHSMSYDTMLPIFLQDDNSTATYTAKLDPRAALAGGLDLSVQTVGLVLSMNGLIELFVQAVIFPLTASRFGTFRLFQYVTLGHPIAYILVPFLVFIPVKLLFPTIYAFLAIRDCFSIITYPLLLIMLKESCQTPSHLGQVNGAAASISAACRTLASPVSGYIYALGVQTHFTPLAWFASALVALGGAVQLLFMKRSRLEYMDEAASVRDEVVNVYVDPSEAQYFDYDFNELEDEEDTRGFEPLLKSGLHYYGP